MYRAGYQGQGRILLADDDDDLRALIALQLKKHGYGVVEFGDGAALLDHIGTLMLGANQIHPNDTVILDVKMPDFSGLQILSSLRHANWQNPIIIVTALRYRGIDEDALRLGASALFHKPFEMSDLFKVLGHFAAKAQVESRARLEEELRQICM